MIPKKDFKMEVLKWADIVGVKPKEIHIRGMKKKLASCSSKGRLTFSYALLNEDYETRSKVIVHELLHLRYPTHNKMFKVMLRAHLSKGRII
jgi:predicted metal-dependent hydrolase